MRKLVLFFMVTVIVGCAEEVIEKPNGLIPEDKMKLVLYDLAVYNSIKTTNPSLLQKNNLNSPTDFVFKKYKIDSVQFVQSDLYYASIPLKYQGMYEEVEARLEEAHNKTVEAREKRTDSIKNSNEKRRDSLKKSKVTDSLSGK